MKTFKVPLIWIETGHVSIKASSWDEAVEKYCNGETGDGLYMNNDKSEGLDDDLLDQMGVLGND